jgi:peptidoglycan/xylan/chitin deacetylase (PgdA/CDA1 family)
MPPALAPIFVASALSAGAIGYGIYALVNPGSSFYGRVHFRAGNTSNSNSIAITFDDGPTDPWTGRILDQLGELNIKSTFFVIGQNVKRFPKLVQRIHAEGHIVANHSYDHPWFGMMRGPWYWRDQIDRTDEEIFQLIGRRPAMFRPPLGVKTWFVHRASRKSNHTMITWTHRARDGVATTPAAILSRFIPATRPGDILLLHDGIEPHLNRDPTASVDVIRPLVSELAQKHLSIVRLDQLLDLPAYRND